MEGHCSTGQSPQWAVEPMEEEVTNATPTDIVRHSALLRAVSGCSLHIVSRPCSGPFFRDYCYDLYLLKPLNTE